LIEEFTLKEIIDFHIRFKPLATSLKSKDLIDILALNKSADKEIRYFSSGMKQRVKLALAICSDSPILLLDEPTTNLDAQGVKWYQDLVANFTKNNTRTVIVASNIEHDYYFCQDQISIADFK
jgi:ABC-type multidrug transport system ATPase subunit